MSQIPDRNKEFIWRNLKGELVLLNPHTGQYFGLNSVGCSFWEKIDGIKTLSAIVDLLLTEFEIDRDTLEKDLYELVETMTDRNIISIEEK